MEDRSQRGAGVFDVRSERAGRDGRVADQSASEVETPIGSASGVLERLGFELAEDDGFGEVLGADDDGLGFAHRSSFIVHRLMSFRSTYESTTSAASASAAAGRAPARINRESTMDTPRKISVPNPPPPIAAAMVATPMATTVAIRMPATIVGIASGNSTCV